MVLLRHHPHRQNEMTTTTEKVERRKLSLLELASNLDNVARACKPMGYSRQQFYELRRNFQSFGAEGVIDRLPGARGPHPNRVPAATEQAILDRGDQALANVFRERPCHGGCPSASPQHEPLFARFGTPPKIPKGRKML